MVIRRKGRRQAVPTASTNRGRQPKLLVAITYRCDPEHRARVERLCRQRGVNQTTMIRMLMDQAITREEFNEVAWRNLFKL